MKHVFPQVSIWLICPSTSSVTLFCTMSLTNRTQQTNHTALRVTFFVIHRNVPRKLLLPTFVIFYLVFCLLCWLITHRITSCTLHFPSSKKIPRVCTSRSRLIIIDRTQLINPLAPNRTARRSATLPRFSEKPVYSIDLPVLSCTCIGASCTRPVICTVEAI